MNLRRFTGSASRALTERSAAIAAQANAQAHRCCDLKHSRHPDLCRILVNLGHRGQIPKTILRRQMTPYGQKIGTAEEPVLYRSSSLPERPSCYDGKQAGFLELRRLPRSPNRGAQVRGIRVPGLNLGRAITPPLDGNSAGAHPIAPGIEQTSARGGYPYHEGTAGRYPYPGDCARHDNVRHILSAPAAASTRPRGSLWTSTPPSPTEPSAPHRHSSSDSARAARAVQPDLTQ